METVLVGAVVGLVLLHGNTSKDAVQHPLDDLSPEAREYYGIASRVAVGRAMRQLQKDTAIYTSKSGVSTVCDAAGPNCSLPTVTKEVAFNSTYGK